jgi:D-glycero-D-manno-heptose 1,7-bisphosphate phosphatase
VSPRRAAFLDRDGTIIADVNYISRPDDVALMPGSAEAIRILNEHAVSVVVITNQSGIAQGRVTQAQYDAVRQRMDEVLGSRGAHVDATYYCPHYPAVSGPCDCRKPGTLLFDEAIADLDLDAAASMFAGDRLRDVLPARAYGGAAFLVRATSTPSADVEQAAVAAVEVVDSLLDAVRQYLSLADGTAVA